MWSLNYIDFSYDVFFEEIIDMNKVTKLFNFEDYRNMDFKQYNDLIKLLERKQEKPDE